jgi:hypothetical protein
VSVVSRAVAAIPARTSTQTWQAICGLLAPPGTTERARLEAVTNVAAILIAAEYTSQAPIIVSPPSGPRVRIRTVHGPGAPDAQADESPLITQPCAGTGWSLSLPCGIDDIDEMNTALAEHPGIGVRDVTEGITADIIPAESDSGEWEFDYDEMERP